MFRVPRSGVVLLLTTLFVSGALGGHWLSSAGPVRAASPTPTAPPVLIDPLDPRAGEDAGAVGAPLVAALVVIGIGAAAAGATLAYVRFRERGRRAG